MRDPRESVKTDGVETHWCVGSTEEPPWGLHRREVGGLALQREGVAALLLDTPVDAHTPGPIPAHTCVYVCLCASMVNICCMGGPWRRMHNVSSAVGSVSCTGVAIISRSILFRNWNHNPITYLSSKSKNYKMLIEHWCYNFNFHCSLRVKH